MPAKTYIPEGRIGWWGSLDIRVRCRFDDKVVLTNEQAEKVATRSGMEVYTGPCGHIHVGHKRRLDI